MKTKKNQVNTMFMNIHTAEPFNFAFTACSDGIENDTMDSVKTQIEIPASGLDIPEQHCYAIPYKVGVNGDWKIEFSFNEANQISYLLSNHGHGPPRCNDQESGWVLQERNLHQLQR